MTLSSLILEIEQKLADSQSDLDMIENVLLGHGHVVMCGELALNFDTHRNIVQGVKGHGAAGRVMRFSRQDAMRVAATIQNGRGDKGRAVFVGDAIRMEIQRYVDILAMLKLKSA